MRKKTIHIKWEERIPIDSYRETATKDNIGVYMITKVWGEYSGSPRPEQVLYIGKTIHSFESRIKSHIEYWIPYLRGSIYVRFGIIQEEFDDDLLEDIESALIYQIQPQENSMKTRGYTFKTDYLVDIISEGCENLIDKKINAKDQVDPSTV